MKYLQLLIIVLIANTVLAEDRREDTIRRAPSIQVTTIDTVTGYDKFYNMPDENLVNEFGDDIDSLMNSWYVKNAFILDSVEIVEGEVTHEALHDSLYIQRLQAIDADIDLSYNTMVKNLIAMYTIRKRKNVEVMLGLSNYYFPIFEEMLDKYNMPMELKYLPIIESALIPSIRSRASAVGLWQFMYGTGKMYKLEINTFVDERCDPVKASEAAVRYLNDLYKIYKNWHLVIAAYNCGPGNVNKAIKRSGGVSNYWSIYYRLPKETRGYVPAFIAATYVMENYQKHNLQPKYPDFPMITDTLVIHDYLHFNQISQTLNIPIEQLRALNPQYRRDIIPARKDKPYVLKVPIEQISAFIEKEKEIFNFKREEYFPNNAIVEPKERDYVSHSDVTGKDKIIYTVKSGDVVGNIANKYKVSAASISSWNGLRKNFIKVGQKLVIYVPASKSGKQTLASNAGSSGGASATLTTGADPEFEYYIVRKGENLWTIAQKFPGVSNTNIMELNGLRRAENIFPGQKLKIRKKA